MQLSADGTGLTVSGTRLPSEREVAAMKKQLLRDGASNVESLLRLGSGRYVILGGILLLLVSYACHHVSL